MVFDIQRFSLDDGPGVRTTVFLKGCRLRCAWCHNPESFEMKPSVMFWEENCISCGTCAALCPHQAWSAGNGGRTLDRASCVACGQCARNCPAGAIRLSGRWMTAGEVMEEVLKDELFFARSGGGLTLSGGEPCLQPEFAGAVLRGAREHGLHTVLDTAGYCPWDDLSELLALSDLVLYDIKAVDPLLHQELTGRDNELILANLERLARTGKTFWVRMVVAPGLNDRDSDIDAFACRLARLRDEAGGSPSRVELLPYHRLGSGKYKGLGLPYALAELEPPAAERLEEMRASISRYLPGLLVRIGGKPGGPERPGPVSGGA